MFTREKIFALMAVLLFHSLSYAQGNWVSFTSDTVGTPPIIEVLESNNSKTVIHITIPGMWVKDTLVNGTTYQILKIPDYGTMFNVGEPQLPALRELVAIPPISNVNISVMSTITPLILNGYIVYPYQEAVPEGEPPAPFVIDTVLYSTNFFYPGNVTELSDPAVWRDVRVVHSSFYPITFNPVTHQLNVCYDFTITLNYWGISNINPLPGSYPICVEPQYASMYKSQIINYDWLGILEDKAPPTHGYLVITSEQYANAIAPFVFWKHKKGFETRVKIVSAGSTPAHIKRLILDDYESRKTKWVLLVGDHADIPAASTPFGLSDYWYTLLTGNDHYPELAIGRFLPSNTTDVTTMVNKTFAYERTPCAGWDIDEVLLVVCFNCTDSYRCKQYIRTDVMEPINFKVDTAYAMDTLGIYCYATNDTVKHYIQEDSGVSIVNYRGHGGTQYWGSTTRGWSSEGEYFTNSDVNSLNNFWSSDSAWLPLVFNFCCKTGYILDPECLVEAWTRNPDGGAVGALGATGVTYWQVSNPMDTILFERIFGSNISVTRPIYEIGNAINYAKVWVINHPPSGVTMDQILQVVYRHLWAGDPSLWVWTDSSGNLASLAVSHPTLIGTQPTKFRVTVKDNANDVPVPSALVCLYKESDIYEKGFTDVNGQVTFQIEPATGGTLYVTVTSHHYLYNYYYNYQPYEGTCIVMPTPGGPMSSDSCSIPISFALGENYPNPCSRFTFIPYQIPARNWVMLKVYNVEGRLLKTLVNEVQSPGYYKVLWNGEDESGKVVASGIYFYCLEAGDFTAMRKMVLMR